MMTTFSKPQSNNLRTPAKIDGRWLFNWYCGVCMDSGLIKTLIGHEQCTHCQAFLDPASSRIFGAICALRIKDKPIDDALFNMARALVAATSDSPIQGDALAFLLECDARTVKHLIKRLKDEWRIAVCGRREPPYGYFIARSADEFLEWMRTTRSQAISELATAYQLFNSNFPQLAGQQSLDFVNVVSNELQEAIR